MIRLDKMLANLGYGSRKEVKLLIRKGHVMINGTVIKKDDFRLDPEKDRVEVDGALVVYKPIVYIMMNKPQGVISATEDKYQPTVVDLLEGYDHYKVFPVGRLDKDTEGLLLLTNDGRLARELLFPSRDAYKTYYARLDADLNEADVQHFASGVMIDTGYTCKPAILEIEESTRSHREDHRGQISSGQEDVPGLRQACHLFKTPGDEGVKLDLRLKPGAYRELTKEEEALLGIPELGQKK